MQKQAFIFFIVIGLCIGVGAHFIINNKEQIKSAPQNIQRVVQSGFQDDFVPQGFAGQFLSSHFAQNRYDWKRANRFLDKVLKIDPANQELLKRSMILAIGSGDVEIAAQRAAELIAEDKNNSLALLILAIHKMAKNDMKGAIAYLDQMPAGDMTAFVVPLIKGWAHAELGAFSAENFNETPFHIFHKAMIANYLGKKEQAKSYIKTVLSSPALSAFDAERSGDFLIQLGQTDGVLDLYKGAYLQNSDEKLEKKIKALENDDKEALEKLVFSMTFEKASEGAALAMYDMAHLLFRELSDSSAKIFAHMALALNPKLTDAHILIGESLIRNERYADAIKYFKRVPHNHDNYMEAQHRIAELWAEAGEMERAVDLLNELFTKHDDVESLIRLGDLYRHEENYGNALKIYNKAAKHIGQDIPEKYWYLLYARGMAYEREGKWGKAENDLKAALIFRPDHPYLLNYLGYSWADQGVKLEESRKLIEKAVSLRPQDGYIKDSLGWVLYMATEYKEAVPHLEDAVELLPYDATINNHLGDAYWQVGRKIEAKFQWERALNFTEDEELAETIKHKLHFGLTDDVKEAVNKK